jgi:K+-sensing histidine kinase KdpD
MMRSIILILLLTISFSVSSQEKVRWDKNVPVTNDIEITNLLNKLNKNNLKSGKISKEDSKIYKEVGKILYNRGKYEEADYYLSKSRGYVEILEVKEVEPEKVFDQPKVNQPLSEIESLKKDKEFLESLPKSYDNVNKEDMKKLAKMLDSQIEKLIKEKEALIAQKANQEIIEAKDGTIRILKKEKEIVDLNIEKDDLIVEKDELSVQKNKLKNYLIWASIGISLLVLSIVVLLQRKTIKVQDEEIENQLKDIAKKNTYLEHAARIIRHDMHSGINTYIPRGINSLEKRITIDDVKNLKIEGSIKMIKEGLSHTQKVYKSVYEFTNLVKQNVVLNKSEVDLKDILTKYLTNTSYMAQVELGELVKVNVNEALFCNAVDNLIKNGLKYNDSEKKMVRIYMEDDDLIVQDNGRGMTQKDFEKVLYSYSKKKNKDIDGEVSGLGLNICLAILTEHGFNLTCEKNEIGTKIKIKIKKND